MDPLRTADMGADAACSTPGSGPRAPSDLDRRFEQLLRLGLQGEAAARQRARDVARSLRFVPGDVEATFSADAREGNAPAETIALESEGGHHAVKPASPQANAAATSGHSSSRAGESSGEKTAHATNVQASSQVQRDPTAPQADVAAPQCVNTAGAVPVANAGDGEPRFDLERIASRVEKLFRSATGGIESWTVSLDLDPALPQTIVRIRASRTWITLRFSTQSVAAARLLSRHMPALEEHLEESLDMRHQIDVDLE